MPRKAVLKFFKVCPTAEETNEKKLKKIVKALEPFNIDESVIHNIIKFTGIDYGIDY